MLCDYTERSGLARPKPVLSDLARSSSFLCLQILLRNSQSALLYAGYCSEYWTYRHEWTSGVWGNKPQGHDSTSASLPSARCRISRKKHHFKLRCKQQRGAYDCLFPRSTEPPSMCRQYLQDTLSHLGKIENIHD